MKKPSILFSMILSLIGFNSLLAQCPATIHKLNDRKIKYTFDNLGAEIPVSVDFNSNQYALDRSGSSVNFFSQNFLNNQADHQSVLTFNYDNRSEECVYDANGNRSSTAPVELSLFTAKLDGKDVELNWITQIEVNNAEFELQQSFDALNFETIAIIDGAGNSDVPVGYNFVDNNIEERTESETVYYQLQQFDFDGTSSYSGIIAVKLNVEKDEFKITKVSGWKTGDGDMCIYYNNSAQVKQVQALLANMSAKVYDQRTLYPEPGINSYEVNIQRLKNPIYIVSLNNGRTIISKKIALSSGY